MFLPGCIFAMALFVFTGNPHDPQTAAIRDQDHARTLNNR